jgi:uncharacterized protein (DUF1501 family)
MTTRREFLRTSLRASPLVALAPTIPTFLTTTARAAAPAADSRVLVVIQLEGGNDGVNTVVSFADEGYARHRTALRLPTDRLPRVTKEVGLHPALGLAARLLEAGQLSIVQGVGYPNPSRSHFQSMAVWHTAAVPVPGRRRDDPDKVGWLGRVADREPSRADGMPSTVHVGEGEVPVALWGRRSAASIARSEDPFLHLARGANPDSSEGDNDSPLAAYVRRSTLDAYAASDRMAGVLRAEDRGARYPATDLAGRLQIIARLLKGGVRTRVFYTSHGWYDTHADQLPAHAGLLGEFAGALKVFLDDLAAARLADRVAVLCFSEFGRRVAENGSAGTDHGTAGPVFLAGPGVRPGLAGEAPRLLDLEDGDLKVGIDFRRVYATVLEGWLGLRAKDATDVLGGVFEQLPLFRI